MAFGVVLHLEIPALEPAEQLTEIRYVLLLYAQMDRSVLKKGAVGFGAIWGTRTAPPVSGVFGKVSVQIALAMIINY